MATAYKNETPPDMETITVKLEFDPEQPNSPQFDFCACCLVLKQPLVPEMDVHVNTMWNVFNIRLIRANDRKLLICEDCIKSMEEAALFKQLVFDAQVKLAEMVQTQSTVSESSKVTIKIEDIGSEWDSTVPDTGLNTSDLKSSSVTEDSPKQEPRASLAIGTHKAQPGKQENKQKKTRRKRRKSEAEEKLGKSTAEMQEIRESTIKLIHNSNLTLFRWYKNKYKCFCCEETFLDHNLLRDHSKMHNIEEIGKIIHEYNLKYYYKAEITSLKCSNCGINVDNIKLLIKHLITDHNIKFKVEDTLLIAYKLSDDLNCLICNDKFKSFISLDRHMNVHYNNYVCDVCGKGFRSKRALTAHAIRHDDSKKFECKRCSITFANFYRLRQHVIKQHNCTAGHVCPHCGDKFNSYHNRLFHLVKEHGHKKPEFHCDMCSKCFHNKALLKRHILKVHLQERNAYCSLCESSFFHPSELKRHMQDVHGSRNFKCTYCPKAFMMKRYLNDHLAIHIEALRHVCTSCGKTFAQKSNMKLHMKTHLKEGVK